jgi:Tol biopolymer transport system component
MYRATRNGVRNLYSKSADGTGDEERLTTKPGMLHTPSSASIDGQWLLFTEVGPQSDRQVWRVRLTGSHEAELMSGKEPETHPVISRDGKWLAVAVLSTGDVELYVRPYPGPGARLPISRNGGGEPLWGRDGKSLYFQRDDGFYVVDVTTGSAFSATAPRLLFRHRFEPSANGVTGYGQGKDGRFLRVESVKPARPMDTINVVLNWTEELRRLVR